MNAMNETPDDIAETVGDTRLIGARNNAFARELVQLLTVQNETVSVAESCTGGLLAATLTDVPGASKVFPGGAVTYANEIKERLGVPAETLAQFGAVSAQCAGEMARAAAAYFGTDYALSTTGFAGPDGGDAAHPPGTVFIGFYSKKSGGAVQRHFFQGGREEVRAQAVNVALKCLLTALSRKRAQKKYKGGEREASEKRKR
jgi:PncC family amidohydrolase